jgi:hypothetical protein
MTKCRIATRKDSSIVTAVEELSRRKVVASGFVYATKPVLAATDRTCRVLLMADQLRC